MASVPVSAENGILGARPISHQFQFLPRMAFWGRGPYHIRFSSCQEWHSGGEAHITSDSVPAENGILGARPTSHQFQFLSRMAFWGRGPYHIRSLQSENGQSGNGQLGNEHAENGTPRMALREWRFSPRMDSPRMDCSGMSTPRMEHRE